MSVKYFVCLDFEATCWPGDSRKGIAEIIEFPAVLLNATTGRVESEFHQFVRPTNHPILSSYCLDLTGITQQQIDRANLFPEVYRDFLKWLDEISAEKHLVFYTKENRQQKIGQNVTFCSWSSFDLRHYFQLEMVRHKIDRLDSMAIWIDFQHEFQKKHCGRWRFDRALQRLNIRQEGRAHSGIADARNLAKLVVKMNQNRTTPFTFQKI